jgi:hypothetical protein
MPFLPFETLVIETSLSKEEVAANLADNIEPAKTIRFWIKPDRKTFEGHLINDEFKITRIISYRNSFLPVINGELQTIDNSTHITMKMRLHVAVIIFMTVWFSGIMLLLVIGLANTNNHNAVLVVPFGMLLFGYALMMGCYLFESSRAKQILTEITKGQIIKRQR